MPQPYAGPVPQAEPGRRPIQRAAMVFGVVLVVLGVLGFVPGVTSPFDALGFTEHGARLFGLFWTSGLDNLVAIVFGVVGLVTARSAFGSAVFLGPGGLFYFFFWLYSVLADPTRSNDSFALGAADWILHIALALGMIVTAVLTRPRRAGVTPALNDPPLDGTPTPN